VWGGGIVCGWCFNTSHPLETQKFHHYATVTYSISLALKVQIRILSPKARRDHASQFQELFTRNRSVEKHSTFIKKITSRLCVCVCVCVHVYTSVLLTIHYHSRLYPWTESLIPIIVGQTFLSCYTDQSSVFLSTFLYRIFLHCYHSLYSTTHTQWSPSLKISIL
jgi:hypothetical protein